MVWERRGFGVIIAQGLLFEWAGAHSLVREIPSAIAKLCPLESRAKYPNVLRENRAWITRGLRRPLVSISTPEKLRFHCKSHCNSLSRHRRPVSSLEMRDLKTASFGSETRQASFLGNA